MIKFLRKIFNNKNKTENKMKTEVKHIQYSDVVNDELLAGNIDNDEYIGFLEDYRVLHCLMRKYKPKSVFECATNMGRGTKIIKNAVGENSHVYSIDLPYELAHVSLQHPVSEGKGDSVGHLCDLPYTQLRGDSRTFDFTQYPCEAYFLDAEHTFDAINNETKQTLKCNPKLIVYHDANLEEVYNGILDAFDNTPSGKNYELFYVDNTRILFAVRK